MTEQLLVRLPEELVRRFKRAVAPRRRSKFSEQLLEQALPPQGDPATAIRFIKRRSPWNRTKPWRRRWSSGSGLPLTTA